MVWTNKRLYVIYIPHSKMQINYFISTFFLLLCAPAFKEITLLQISFSILNKGLGTLSLFLT